MNLVTVSFRVDSSSRKLASLSLRCNYTWCSSRRVSLPETALISKLQATVLRKTIGENKKDLFPREILGSMEFTEAKIMTRLQIFMYLFRFKFTKIYKMSVIWKNIQKIYLNSRYNIFKGWNLNFPFLEIVFVETWICINICTYDIWISMKKKN